jgi:hypothetical protein
MEAQNSFRKFTESTGGKVGIALLVVGAVGVLIFEVSKMGTGEESRQVPPKQVISEAQLQIDAINKMTNLTPAQKKAMIDHEQGEINIAKGSTKGDRGAAGPAATGG